MSVYFFSMLFQHHPLFSVFLYFFSTVKIIRGDSGRRWGILFENIFFTYLSCVINCVFPSFAHHGETSVAFLFHWHAWHIELVTSINYGIFVISVKLKWINNSSCKHVVCFALNNSSCFCICFWFQSVHTVFVNK